MKFDDLLLQFCNAAYKWNTKERWTKSPIILFPKKGSLRITNNYWGITLTSIVANVYNAQLLNHIKSETEKILWKNLNDFWRK